MILAEQQHDDHVWMVYQDKGWAIRSIERRDGVIFFNLWRGYWPSIEYTTIGLVDPDWSVYCERAVEMIYEDA